jgi:hypothetical protein
MWSSPGLDDTTVGAEFVGFVYFGGVFHIGKNQDFYFGM